MFTYLHAHLFPEYFLNILELSAMSQNTYMHTYRLILAVV